MAVKVKQNVQIVNYELRRGDDFNPTLNLSDSNEVTLDLTSHTARLQIKDEIDGVVIESLTELSGITLTSSSPNISISIDKLITEAYTFSTAVYDLELTDSLGITKTLMEGSIELKLDIST